MNEHSKPGSVGILVCAKPRTPPFADQAFYSRLCRIGRRLCIQVYVFAPEGLRLQEDRVDGYTFDPEQGGWTAGSFPLPDVVYDRSFCDGPSAFRRYRACVRELNERPDIRFLGHGLRGKLHVHRMLLQDEALRPHLPDTKPLTGWERLLQTLHRDGALFLKPQAGSKGKGALRLVREAEGIRVDGRTQRNTPVSRYFVSDSMLRDWLAAFIGRRPYLIQPYLALTAKTGEPFDVRCLMQKDRHGVWTVTGAAVRCGAAGSVTSNLHGGGAAKDMMPFLTEQFGPESAERIRTTLFALAARIPAILEQHHGRLAELGIDLGIDSAGKVWILEANSKPGRTAFSRLADRTAQLASVRNPMLYARYLLDTTRRVIS